MGMRAKGKSAEMYQELSAILEKVNGKFILLKDEYESFDKDVKAFHREFAQHVPSPAKKNKILDRMTNKSLTITALCDEIRGPIASMVSMHAILKQALEKVTPEIIKGKPLDEKTRVCKSSSSF